MVMVQLSKFCVARARRIRKIGGPSRARNMSLGRLKVKTNRKSTDGPLLRCENYLLCRGHELAPGTPPRKILCT
jgi:hypothetical protein